MACNCNGTDPPSCIKYNVAETPIIESIYHDGANYGGIHNQLECYKTQIGKAKDLLQHWTDLDGHSDLDTLNLLCEIFDICAATPRTLDN